MNNDKLLTFAMYLLGKAEESTRLTMTMENNSMQIRLALSSLNYEIKKGMKILFDGLEEPATDWPGF